MTLEKIVALGIAHTSGSGTLQLLSANIKVTRIAAVVAKQPERQHNLNNKQELQTL